MLILVHIPNKANSQEPQSIGQIVVRNYAVTSSDTLEEEFSKEKIMNDLSFRCNIAFNDGVVTHFTIF